MRWYDFSQGNSGAERSHDHNLRIVSDFISHLMFYRDPYNNADWLMFYISGKVISIDFFFSRTRSVYDSTTKCDREKKTFFYFSSYRNNLWIEKEKKLCQRT